ncbi:MAG: electron transport complex protein RnfC, partial [Desulfotignum sp.]|nr:electron transport complex protein RnfC [Desulfotignum sp.]
MIKRSFFALSRPRLTYDRLEPNPESPRTIAVPDILTLLLPEPIDDTRQALIRKGNAVKKAQKLSLYKDSTAYAISPVSGTIKSVDIFADGFNTIRTCITIEKDSDPEPEPAPLDISEDLSFAAGYM